MTHQYPLLDPKLDIVFKMLLADTDAEPILVAILNAVIKPESPICHAKVLNPKLPLVYPDDKGTTLDIHAELADQHIVNIEMQMQDKRDTQVRALYHWARMFAGQLKRGRDQTYSTLKNTYSVFFLNYIEFPSFPGLLDQTLHVSHSQYSDYVLPYLNLHFIELPKLLQQPELLTSQSDKLAFWCQFLLNPSDSTLEDLVMKEPAIKKAQEKLQKISNDAEKRELARMREKADLDWRSSHESALRVGREQGREEGREEGREQAQSDMILKLIKQTHFQSATPQELSELTGIPETVIRHILREKKLPKA
jgi:predicted transposase/invertase (TIGR01784 family)